jgi:tetratricopeptide (TPR) repeat protein
VYGVKDIAMTESDFTALLALSESDTIDFKTTGYDIKNVDSCLALVKDVICMANTPRDRGSCIVTGVKKYADGRYDLIGLQSHTDDADLQGQFVDRVYPPPKFNYMPITYSGLQFGIISIPPVKVGPSVPIRDFDNLLRKWQIYFRRNSRNSIPTPPEIAQILSWFGTQSNVQTTFEDSTPAWQRFTAEVQNFDPALHYILLVSPGLNLQTNKLSAIGRVPWTSVFDFDTNSDINGLLASCKATIESRRSLHINTLRDTPQMILNSGTYWYFTRGLAGRPETIHNGRWLDWNRSDGAALTSQFHRLATASNPHPVIIVVVWQDLSLIRHLQSTIDGMLGAFGNTANFVILTTTTDDYIQIAQDIGATLLNIPIDQLCAGITSMFLGSGEQQGVRIPCSSGAPITIPADDLHWFEEEIEIIGLDEGSTPYSNQEVGRGFLKGNEISWYDLGLHYDVDRDLLPQIERQLDREIEIRKISRINLYHAPGAGGTTVGHRILWDMHKRIPCVLLRRTRPRETTERVLKLIALTGLPVLMLVDGSEVSSREMDELYDFLKSQQAAVIVLQILRRFAPQKEGLRTFYLPSELSNAEAGRFAHVFARENPARRSEIEKLARSTIPHLRVAFYFGLLTFLENFAGLQPFIRQHIGSLSAIQKKSIGFVAICHHYAQRAFPVQAFASELGLPANRKVDPKQVFGEGINLLVNTEDGIWRTAHELIAMEVIEQLLWPTSSDRRLWRQNLSTWAIDFANVCRGTTALQSDSLLEIVRRTFFFRDNTDLLGTERSGANQFAQMVEDIPSKEGKLEVLRQVTELFPEEAHFWAHLGRFYALQMKDYVEAGNCIDRAIELDPKDSVLHHMRGMAYRYQAYQLMDEGNQLADVVELARQASQSFGQARNSNPDDDHGYISEVQMIARLVAYAGHDHPQGTLGYLGSTTADPFLRDCIEHAEGLLEIVRRHREGEGSSPYEVDCRARLDQIYGRHDHALQVWDSLLTRNDVYAPPVRRQIVWTYLARRNRNWDDLPSKEADRIVQLLEDNLTEEPDRESNLRLWVQAVRRSVLTPTLSTIIEKVANWRARSGSLDATYYLYVLYALQATDGVPLAHDSTMRFLEECRAMARFRRDRTKSYEWLGKGVGARRLVHHSQLGDWDTSKEFWQRTSSLSRIEGRIAKIDGLQAGEVELSSGLTAFFVPGKSGFTSKNLNHKVSFFLGFSFDGMRAWDVREVKSTV